jgi:serine/threonine-protein kinase RsbW
MQEASLHFTSDVAIIESVREFVKGHAAANGFGDENVYTLQLAVVEAVTNVIVHAYEGEIGHPIWLEAQVDADALTFVVRDQGREFDLRSHPDPDLKRHMADKIRGGLGVYLMRKLMDELELRREGPFNVLRMRKRLGT